MNLRAIKDRDLIFVLSEEFHDRWLQNPGRTMGLLWKLSDLVVKISTGEILRNREGPAVEQPRRCQSELPA